MPNLDRPYNSTYTGNATARDIDMGFKPDRVTIYNITDGDSITIHMNGMTADTAIQITSAVALVASGAVTLTNNGISLGTDSSVNENAKVFRIYAE